MFNFSFSNISGWGIDLDYCDIECFALEMNQDHCVIFEIAPKYCISDSFVGYKTFTSWWSRSMCDHPARTPKLQLTTKQPSTVECWIQLKKKKILHIQEQRRSPNKMVGGAKLHLKSNTVLPRYAQRAQTKPFVHQDSETQQRLSQT